MGIADVIVLLGGVAMFLFGMGIMGDGLKRVAGNKLEIFLWKLSNTPIKGVLLGTGVTAVIQSSSATTVMVVGFVNSGMMTVLQAIGVIMGANIGTSVTGWILSLSMLNSDAKGWLSLFSTACLSAIFALIGILLRMTSKSQTKRHIGDIMLGFAVLMYGMKTMAGSVEPLSSSEAFISAFTMFKNPFLAILAGVVLTSVVQSASAAIGILQALAVTGVIDYAAAIPIIMGIGIGASTPVLLSAIGADSDARRTSYIYLFINVLGTLVWSVLFYTCTAFVEFPMMGKIANAFDIALMNSVYRILMVAVLFPFVKQIEKFSRHFVKERANDGDVELFKHLEERFIAHPALAVEQSKLAMCEMTKKVRENLARAILIIGSFDQGECDAVAVTEEIIDDYEDKLGTYLVKITGTELDDMQNRSVSRFLHTVGDFERIGDHAVNLAQAASEIHNKKIHFTSDAESELKMISGAVLEILRISSDSFVNDDIAEAYRVEPLEQLIDVLCDKAKLHHIERVRAGECTLEHGFVFNDMITDFERIADHCSNIGVAMIELEADAFDTHEYLTNLKTMKTDAFNKYFHEYEDIFGF